MSGYITKKMFFYYLKGCVLTLKSLAKHILAVAHKEKMEVTNLQLQKVLFFTMGLAIKGDPSAKQYFSSIYNNDFERWRYGPVARDVYFEYNIYGNRPIDDKGHYSDELKSFDSLIRRLLEIDVFRLVALSHRMKSWKEYEDEILSGKWVPPYSIEEIVRDFNE